MRTANCITISLVLTGIVLAADAHARPARPAHRVVVVPARSVHMVTAPTLRSRSIFIQIAPPQRLTYHYVTVPAPAPVIVPTPAPVIIGQPSVTVWITNANGSRSSVVLKREGPWYVGPRGEYYATIPTECQLRPLYGLGVGHMPSDTVGVYILTNSGALRLVNLTRSGNGFIGPSGEYYSTMPTESQLRLLYGR